MKWFKNNLLSHLHSIETQFLGFLSTQPLQAVASEKEFRLHIQANTTHFNTRY